MCQALILCISDELTLLNGMVTSLGTVHMAFMVCSGHVCLIVNVACKCGLTTSNYKQLQALHDELAESKGLRILAFPSNQFASQVNITS